MSGSASFQSAGLRPAVEPGAKFHVRYPDASGKFIWRQAYDTFEEAQKEAAGLELNAMAVAQGLTLEEYKNRANANRTLVKSAIESFLAEAAKTKKENSLAAYKQHLAQFQESLQRVRFMDEITKKTLCDFRDFLADKGYEARTQHNRLMTVLSLLKKNKIKTDFSLKGDLPEYEEEPAVPYEPAELKKLFAAMTPEETIRYKFFLGTAARDKEVAFAAWQDIDFARGIYHIRRKPDVGFTPKKHESRDVKMPTELTEMLRQWKNNAPHSRWIFVNEEGRRSAPLQQAL